MNLSSLLCLLVSIIAVASFQVELNTGTEGKINEIIAHLDFSFDKVLISKQDITCIPENGCAIKKQEPQKDEYNGTAYSYHEAELTVNVHNKVSQQLDPLNVAIRLTDMSFSVLGLNPRSILQNSLKGKPLLEILTYYRRLYFVEDRVGHSLDVYQQEDDSIFYVNAALVYRISYNIHKINESEMPARICFHDKDVTQPQYYFFSGNELFQRDWDNFLDVMENNFGVDFEAEVKPADDSGDFEFTYDLNLFDSYDGDPMKNYTGKDYHFCDLFLGDFGAHRSSISFLLSHNYADDKLDVSMITANQPYLQFETNYFKFFIYVFVFSTLLYLGYLCYQKLNVKTETDYIAANEYYHRVN